MADREIYRKYDADGNLVDEIYLKPGSPEALAAEEARKGGGQVGEWKILDESGHRGIAGADNIFKQISNVVDYYAPQVKVNGEGNGLIITGSTEALDSEVAKQLQQFLDDTFQYSDLKSENINQAIEAINKDLREQITKSATSLYGGDYDKISGYKNGVSTMEMVRDARASETAWRNRIAQLSGEEKTKAEKAFRDYLNSAETMGRINPMNLSGDDSREKYGIWGYKKNGEEAKLLPQEWIDYYRENYNTQERARLFANSYLMSKGVGEEGTTLQQLADPYYWTPYLVMSGGEGGDTPVYGFDTWENIQGFFKALLNEGVGKLLEGPNQALLRGWQFALGSQDYGVRRNLNDVAKIINHYGDIKSSELPWMTEEQFNEKLKSLHGKQINTLNSENAAFMAAALNNEMKMDATSAAIGDSELGPYWKNNNYQIPEDISKYASYESYMKARDTLLTLEEYDRSIDKASRAGYESGRKWLQDEVDASSIYAPVSVGIGNFAGVVIRTLAEAGAISGLTGGAVNLTNIGDDLADSIIKLISKAGSAGATIGAGLSSPIGHFLLTLATEIPEDILQTAVDNVLIGEGEENVKAVEGFIEGGPEAAAKNIADNTLQNLIFRIVFSTGRGAINLAKAMRGAKAAADAAQDVVTIDPDQVLRESLDLKSAADDGKFKGFNEDGRAVIIDENGNERVLENVHANSFKDTGNETLDAAGEAWRKAHGDNANIPRPDETIDKNGVGTKTVNIDGSNVKVDYEIADRVAAINEDGFTTYNSHSGMASDHGKASDAGGGYLHFSGDLDKAKKDAIKTAAEAAGMGVYEDINPVYGASLTVRQSNTADGLRLEDVIKMANEETVAKYGLDPDNWVDDALKKGILSDALDYRSSAEKRIYSEHGGYMQPDDIARRESWDTFFEKLGGYENATPRSENIDIARLENTAPDSASAAWEPVRIKKNYYNDGMTVQDTTRAVIADVPSDPTQLNNWHMNGQESIMEAFRQNTIPEFERTYPTPEDQSSFVRNMDYLFHLQKKERLSLDESIGKSYEIDGVEYTVRAEDVEFYRNFIEPQMVELRKASQEALGKEIPTTMGYFPHTDYSPEFMTGDELVEQGVLYKEYSGASAMVDGNFTTSKLSDDLNQRYRVFVNNMLWDAAGDRVAAARMMEEFHADGVEATAEQVNEIVRKKKDNIRALNKSEGGKAVDEAFETQKISSPEQIVSDIRQLDKEIEDLNEQIRKANNELVDLEYEAGPDVSDDDIRAVKKRIADAQKKLKTLELNRKNLSSQRKNGAGEVDSAFYRTGLEDSPFGKKNVGYYEFIQDNLIKNTDNDLGNITIEQSLITPGGAIDDLNADIRNGTAPIKNGEIDREYLKKVIKDKIDLEQFARNRSRDYDQFTNIDFEELSNDITGKKLSGKEADEALKDLLAERAVDSFYNGTSKAGENIILYRVVSSEGNTVSEDIFGDKKPQGDISWLNKRRGDYEDNGVAFATMDPEAVLSNEKLAGSGNKYILRMHIGKGTPMFAFDNDLLTGEGGLLLDTYRFSRGDRAGGEFALAPNKGKFIDSGEVDAHGNKIIDVYINTRTPKEAGPVIDYDKINDKIEESSGGWANRVHDAYGGVYGQARGEINQPIIKRFNTQAEWLRKMRTADGSLYDNGGRMVVAGDADAGYLAKRIFEENMSYQQVKEMLVEYLTQFNRRTTKGAEWLADKWMNTILEKANHQPLSRKSLASLLQNLVYYEGVSRVNRWVARADLTKFKKTNVKLLDSFLYRQGIVSRHLNNAGVMAKLNDAANLLIKARAEALFWGNFKNGVLQLSECIRIATEFDLPDTRKTINRLLVDKEFRQQVREWLDLIKPDRYVEGTTQSQKSKMVDGAVEAMDGIAKKSAYENGNLIVKKLSDSEMGQMVKSLEKLGMSPVEFGENTKNFILMAGILEEADRKGLAGNDLFNYVNKRFERIGLAANDMGKLMAADNPFFRLFTNLKSFGIRETEMFFNNIIDYNNAGQYGKAATYITKTLGWKVGMLLIMAKLGYGAMSVLGLDPFGLMDDQYTGVNEEDYNALDRIVANPITNALLSGGFTSFIPDLYWASRQAYEDNLTPAEDAERALDENRSPFEFSGLSFDDIISVGLGFIPGYTQGQRVINMTDLLNRGWAIGSTGAKKYEAPDNPFDIAAGYLFGPANTPNARAYNQTPDYLQGLIDNGIPGLGQQIGRGIGRYLPWADNSFRQFDPINQNYSDWFNGTKADDQQWRTGYIYFSKMMDTIYNEYTDKLDSTYSDQDRENLQQSYNQQIYDVMTKLKTFSDAYIAKHPEGIDEEKMNNLLNILDTYRNIPGERPDARLERQMDEWESALMRYSQAGLPAITTYRGTDDGTETVYSPQFRAAVQGEFGLPEEASRQIKQLYKDKWKALGQQYRDRLFSTEGSKNKQAIQNEYISIVRQDLDPIVELYGNNIWSNEEVENIIDDVFNSMIPKYGQSVKSYLKGLYQGYHGQIRYAETGNETLKQINLLLDQGKRAQAKALARTLLERVQSSRAYLNRSDLERLQKILND